jgi:hypothetical protein
VDRGLLVGEDRTGQGAGIFLAHRAYASYEMRFRALWGTNFLEIRAVEVAGQGGQVNKFDTVQVNLADNIDPENVNDFVVRVADGKCVITVNGKAVFEQKVRDFGTTPIGLFVAKGRKFLLRDIRVKDLAPERSQPLGGAPAREEKKPEPKPDAPPQAGSLWAPKGGFAEEGGVWTIEEAPDSGAGLLCLAGNAASYELRFKVGRGADGLTVVPRANRGVDRSGGIRLPEAYFEKDEWTEVVLRMDLLTAKATVGGKEAGTLDVEEAVGPPAFRVHGGGRARIRDLSIAPLKK